MSRIGKKAIFIPENVLITLQNDIVNVKGKHGTLEKPISKVLNVIQEQQLIIARLQCLSNNVLV